MQEKTRHGRSRLVYALAVAALAIGCPLASEPPEFTCTSSADCVDGFTCDDVRGVCVETSTARTDGGDRPFEDAGPDVDSGPRVDGGNVDGGRPDGGAVDGGASDAGAPDAGHGDAGDGDAGLTVDGGRDAGPIVDAGLIDGGGVDAGLSDAGIDGGNLDDAGADGGAFDGGSDAGLVDAGPGQPPVVLETEIFCTAEGPCPIILDVSDPDGPGPYTVTVVDGPRDGTVGAFTGLSATYTPDPSFAGTDTIVVQVFDGESLSDPVTLTLRVVSRRSCALLGYTSDFDTDGVYTLFPDGPSGAAIDAYCLFSAEGGGWTLALKADGRENTFGFASSLWTNDTLLNETDLTLDASEAKLAPFVDVATAEVLVQMRPADDAQAPVTSLAMPLRANSLREVFEGDSFVPSMLGRDSWLGLLPDATLQANCNAEGFNVDPAGGGTNFRARIGIVSNEQNDCGSPDSFVGIGAGGSKCGGLDWTTGNQSCASPVGGDRSIPGFAWVFVRDDDFSALDARVSCRAHRTSGRTISGVYRIDPDDDGPLPAEPVYCDMRTFGGGWALLMRITSDSYAHIDTNDAVGTGACLPDSPTACRASTARISTFIARPGTEVFRVLPDDPTQRDFYVRAGRDTDVWPTDLTCPNRSVLATDDATSWILTSYPGLAFAHIGLGGDVGTWEGGGLAYPSPFPAAQLFFGGFPTGMRTSTGYTTSPVIEPVGGTLWVRKVPYEEVWGPEESCLAHLNLGRTTSTQYLINPDGSEPFGVYCDMETAGGGWTIVNSIRGNNGEQPLTSDVEDMVGSPFVFQPLNLNRAKKIALSAVSTESLMVREGGAYLHIDRPLFDQTLDDAGNVDASYDVTVTASDMTSTSATMGWSTYNIGGGGDFGITTRNGGFDHHSSLYRKLNGGCFAQILYSYSVSNQDGDAGYDVNAGLGDWTSTSTCHSFEGGSLRFYSAMR